MTNPFHYTKERVLEIFPWATDLVFVSGKTSRVLFILLLAFVLVAVRDRLVRWRHDVKGDALNINEALVFLGLLCSLHVPYSKVPEISMPLVHGVSIAILVHLISLLFIRLFLARAYKEMVNGNNWAGLRLGVYSVGAGVASNAVLSIAL